MSVSILPSLPMLVIATFFCCCCYFPAQLLASSSASGTMPALGDSSPLISPAGGRANRNHLPVLTNKVSFAGGGKFNVPVLQTSFSGRNNNIPVQAGNQNAPNGPTEEGTPKKRTPLDRLKDNIFKSFSDEYVENTDHENLDLAAQLLIGKTDDPSEWARHYGKLRGLVALLRECDQILAYQKEMETGEKQKAAKAILMHYGNHFESRVENVLSPLTKDNKAAVVTIVEDKISSTREMVKRAQEVVHGGPK